MVVIDLWLTKCYWITLNNSMICETGIKRIPHDVKFIWQVSGLLQAILISHFSREFNEFSCLLLPTIRQYFSQKSVMLLNFQKWKLYVLKSLHEYATHVYLLHAQYKCGVYIEYSSSPDVFSKLELLMPCIHTIVRNMQISNMKNRNRCIPFIVFYHVFFYTYLSSRLSYLHMYVT